MAVYIYTNTCNKIHTANKYWSFVGVLSEKMHKKDKNIKNE